MSPASSNTNKTDVPGFIIVSTSRTKSSLIPTPAAAALPAPPSAAPMAAPASGAATREEAHAAGKADAAWVLKLEGNVQGVSAAVRPDPGDRRPEEDLAGEVGERAVRRSELPRRMLGTGTFVSVSPGHSPAAEASALPPRKYVGTASGTPTQEHRSGAMPSSSSRSRRERPTPTACRAVQRQRQFPAGCPGAVHPGLAPEVEEVLQRGHGDRGRRSTTPGA